MTSVFFGVQMALDLPIGDRRREQLADLVRELRTCTSVITQRPCWTRITAALNAAVPTAHLGTWDLIRKDAENSYEEWASGLEAMAEWPMSDFGEPGRYLLVSLILLVQSGSQADQALGDLCDLSEDQWDDRATYKRLVAAPPLLNFTNVLGSALYLAPRPDQPGFSNDVLIGDGFEYLTRIEE